MTFSTRIDLYAPQEAGCDVLGNPITSHLAIVKSYRYVYKMIRLCSSRIDFNGTCYCLTHFSTLNTDILRKILLLLNVFPMHSGSFCYKM